MSGLTVLRAEEEWQRAGAYSVRIQGMNRQHGLSLREEFDEHDGDGTRYVVLLDGGYPVATCRFYELDPARVTLGRVVVLPEYRGKGIAPALTNRLARAVLEREKVPFYCSAWSNIKSVRNALRSGFRPAWTELTACVLPSESKQ